MKIKYIISISFVVYLFGFFVGFETPVDTVDLTNDVLYQNEYLSIEKSSLVKEIVLNNCIVITLNLIGALSVGLITLLNTFFNGIVLGYSLSSMLKSYSLIQLFSYFIPHSIEILSIILSCVIGLHLGIYVFRMYALNHAVKITKLRLILGGAVFSYLIIFISAYLEVYVSMK